MTGIDIFKQLPKTNCRECGQPTCLAFAMRLAQKQASLDQCPYVSEEAKAALAGASAPPIKLITIGTGERKLEIGNETVLFRHEETFHHPTGLAVTLDASLSEGELAEGMKQAAQVGFERVGQTLCLNAVALKGEGEAFVKAARVAANSSELPIILMNEDPAVMGQALAACAAKRPLIYAGTAANVEAMAALAKQHNCPLAIRGAGLSELADLSEKAQAAGAADLVLDSGARRVAEMVASETAIRRAAVKKRFRPLGFPTIGFAAGDGDGARVFSAATQIMKYTGLVVLDSVEAPELLALLTTRQNIFTDPQKPIQIQEGLYTIGTPGEDSPVLVTTNFSLTYFTVEGDVEASRVPAWVVVVNTEGTSVLTAWAAEKFTAEIIAQRVKESDVGSKVKHRKLIIPGYAAVISGELEEELPDWQIRIGPREAGHIPAFLKMWKPE